MKKLISMTDFVENLRDEMTSKGELNFKETKNYFDKVFNYSDFLKQSLTFGMFVPCDENGNILEDPNWEAFKGYTDRFYVLDKQFKTAKEKVLFKGFESVDTRLKGRYQVKLLNANISGSSDTIQNDFAGLYYYDSFNEKSRVKIIEDLLNFHPLELTESAVKNFS